MYSGLEVCICPEASKSRYDVFAVSRVAEAAAVAGCFYVCGGWDGRQSVSQTHWVHRIQLCGTPGTLW